MKLILFAVFLSLYPPITQAAVLVMSGLTEELNIQKGGTARGVIQLKNTGRKPKQVKIYLVEKSPTGAQKRHHRSNKNWINIGANKITIPPGGQRKINFKIRAPHNAQTGTYWSNLIVEPISSSSKESTLKKLPPVKNGFRVLMTTKTRYSIALMSHIGSGEAKYIFSAPKVAKDQQGRKVFSIAIKNVGNRHGYPKLSMDVFRKNGQRLASLKGAQRGLYPQAIKRFTIPVHTLKTGSYKTLITAEDFRSGRTFGSDLTLKILP